MSLAPEFEVIILAKHRESGRSIGSRRVMYADGSSAEYMEDFCAMLAEIERLAERWPPPEPDDIHRQAESGNGP